MQPLLNDQSEITEGEGSREQDTLQPLLNTETIELCITQPNVLQQQLNDQTEVMVSCTYSLGQEELPGDPFLTVVHELHKVLQTSNSTSL